MNLELLAVVLLSSVATVAAALFVVPRLPVASRRAFSGGILAPSTDTVLLLDGDTLLDSTAAGQRLLEAGDTGSTDRARLVSALVPMFPGIATALDRLTEGDALSLHSPDGRFHLDISNSRGITRAVLDSAPGQTPGADSAAHAAMGVELDILRRVATHSPTLAWQQAVDGTVTWANRAYVRQVEALLPPDSALTWPLPRLFETDPVVAKATEMAAHRVSLDVPGQGVSWFDCIAVSDAGAPLFFAQPADTAVRAETALRNFRQTLTKTFADLPIGLAIFNRSRELVLFNPALVDLCGLDPEFLIARPQLTGVLDRLRDRQMMPEPKDYKSWRARMTALEEQAVNGAYQETWVLPSGQTYRVSGRPHPDGAIAFLFEDISAEISLTRRFRTELEFGQAALDGLDEAIAVFAPSGVLALSNDAYADLWGSDPSTCLGDIGFTEACEHWQKTCGPTPIWAELRSFMAQIENRTAFTREIDTPDGDRLTCRVRPLSGGATLIGFTRLLDVQDRISPISVAAS